MSFYLNQNFAKIKQMFKTLKYAFYIVFLGLAAFLYWFFPKYDYIHKNPQYCVNLSTHIFYCGTDSHLESFYNLIKK